MGTGRATLSRLAAAETTRLTRLTHLKAYPSATSASATSGALAFAFCYVALAFGIDALAFLGVDFIIDWRMFRWTLGDFDLFKFSVWLLIPLTLCWRNLDYGWFGVSRWRRGDAIMLLALVVAGALALLLIPQLPGVSELYPGTSRLPAEGRRALFIGQLVWSASWLPGYEFLNRYLLLRAAAARWPRYGWWLVPLAEGLYHLQKPVIECVAMVIFSILLTRWALTRRNGLLPLLAHLVVELELGLVLLLV